VINMLHGVFAPIPTPFDYKGEIAWDALSENLTWWGGSAMQGIAVAGTNGEAVMLGHEEKIKAFAFCRENLPSAKKVIAGTGCESAKATISLNKEAADCGVDAALVLNPSYFKGSMNDEVLTNYFFHVAESSPLPVILYNMPRNTNVNMNAKTIIKLSEHPNIVGIKDSSGNIVQISEVANNCSDDFFVFAGSANFLLPSLLMGATGGTLALANIMPGECVEIKDLYDKGKLEEARNLQLKIFGINEAVTARFGVAGLKAALDLIGCYGGPPRLPLLPLDNNGKQELKEIMKECQLL